MPTYTYTHLHVHSQLSILDGAIRIPELIQRVKELGMNSVAVSDHGSMHGCLRLYKEAKANDVNGLMSIEAYCTSDPDDTEKKTRDNEHLVLIAKNNQGYKDLMWLISNANLHNFYYKPRISYENLRKRGENLFCLSACLGSRLAKCLNYDEEAGRIVSGLDEASRALDDLHDIFRERFFLELQKNDELKQDPYNEWLLSEGKKRKIPFVVTTDAHYLREEDYKLHTLMMAMQFRKTLAQYQAMPGFKYGKGFYIKSPQQMFDMASELGVPEAAENTQLIADQCKVEITLGEHYFPNFDIKKASDHREYLEWKENQ